MENYNLNSEDEVFLAQWLEGEISDAELKQLVNDEAYNFYLKLRRAINVSAQLESSTDESFNKIQHRIENKKQKARPLYRNWYVAAAASIVILFGLFSLFGNDNIIIETGFGENKTIALLDGSEVILNSKSKISYNKDNWKNNRGLILEGEAYFKVETGNKFTVNTENGSVTVLGTQFNVNSTIDFFDVVCYEGKVRVKTSTSEHILLPSNTIRKINGNPTESSATELGKPTWINGESTFKSVPIKYVILALEHQYNITLDSKNIDDSTIFTGTFIHNNINMALQTVFETLNVRYIEKEERNIELGYKE